MIYYEFDLLKGINKYLNKEIPFVVNLIEGVLAEKINPEYLKMHSERIGEIFLEKLKDIIRRSWNFSKKYLNMLEDNLIVSLIESLLEYPGRTLKYYVERNGSSKIAEMILYSMSKAGLIRKERRGRKVIYYPTKELYGLYLLRKIQVILLGIYKLAVSIKNNYKFGTKIYEHD